MHFFCSNFVTTLPFQREKHDLHVLYVFVLSLAKSRKKFQLREVATCLYWVAQIRETFFRSLKCAKTLRSLKVETYEFWITKVSACNLRPDKMALTTLIAQSCVIYILSNRDASKMSCLGRAKFAAHLFWTNQSRAIHLGFRFSKVVKCSSWIAMVAL